MRIRNVIVILIIFAVYVLMVLINKPVEQFYSGCSVPKIIWCYWDSDKLPPIVKKITDCWKKKLLTWDIRIITPTNIDKYLQKEQIDNKPTHLGSAHFADWLRLYLLRDHGGVWIDSSTIIDSEQGLDKYYTDFCQSGKELFGFHMPWMQTNKAYPVLENYFLMSRPQSPFVIDWCKEFQKAVDMGFGKYHATIRAEGIVDPQYIGEYHTQHLCAQSIIRRRGNPHDYILMYNSLDHVLYHQNKERPGYDRANLQKEISDASFRKEHPVIKLTGPDRGMLNESEFQTC